jgi:hypothetical protein
LELARWSFLVAATGKAMLEVLRQLDGGCVNYWEAGNWALNDQAEPVGPKNVREHRRVHLHLLGRSRSAEHPSWRWGEAPRFPSFADRLTWASSFERLTPEECVSIVAHVASGLRTHYGMCDAEITPWSSCARCSYPTSPANSKGEVVCAECQPEEPL